MKPSTYLSTLLCLTLTGLLGCSHTHGNRAGGRQLITKTSELRRAEGKQVTLIGTARQSTTGGATLDMRGGSVGLPAYTWADELVDHPTMVTGIVFRETNADGQRVYELGEVESADRWSR